MTKLLAVLGILALCATAALATPAVQKTAVIPANQTAGVTLAIDAFAAMNFASDVLHVHIAPTDTVASGNTSDAPNNDLYMSANFPFKVTVTLDPPTVAGVPDSDWTLNAPDSNGGSDTNLVKTYTETTGYEAHKTISVTIAPQDIDILAGTYTDGLVTVSFEAL